MQIALLPCITRRRCKSRVCATHFDNAIEKIGPNMKTDPLCINVIKATHANGMILANNHAFDYGIPGLKGTLAALDTTEIPYTGGVKTSDGESPRAQP